MFGDGPRFIIIHFKNEVATINLLNRETFGSPEGDEL
jgi:hypothetical protein